MGGLVAFCMAALGMKMVGGIECGMVHVDYLLFGNSM